MAPPAPRIVLHVNGPMTPETLQAELLAALTQPKSDLDLVYDFFGISGSFFADQDEYPELVEDLSSEQVAAFAKWLRKKGIALEMRDAPTEVPAAYYFDDSEPLPPSTWVIHHTKGNFHRIDRGATWERLHLSTWWKTPVQAGPKNLEDVLGIGDRVFAFGFQPEDDPAVDRNGAYVPSRKYGPNLILFQTDAAVTAWHNGDEEWQTIFPVGSEYNIYALSGDSYDGTWVVELDGEDMSFATLDEAIEVLERSKE